MCLGCLDSDKGACGQCVVGKCKVAYHPLCAVRNGIQIRFLDEENQFGSACLRHQPGFLRSCGVDGGDVDMMSATDDDVDAETPRQQRRGRRGRLAVDASSQPSSGKRRRSSKNPWSDDDEEEDDSVLDSESDPDVSYSEPGDSDVEIIDVSRPSRVQERVTCQTTKVSRPQSAPIDAGRNSKRVKQSTLSFTVRPPSQSPTPSEATLSQSSASRVEPTVTAPQGSPSMDANSAPASAMTGSPPEDVPDSAVFSPVLSPPSLIARPEDPNEDKFEYVMVLSWSQPLRIGIVCGLHPYRTTGIFLKAASTRNSVVLEALEKGVIRDGDEIVAFNNNVLRDVDMNMLISQIMPTLSLPVRCWIRTARRQPPQRQETAAPAALSAPVGSSTPTALGATNSSDYPASVASTPVGLGVGETQGIASTPSGSIEMVSATNTPTEAVESRTSDGKDAEAALITAALSPDWPWSHYLRSDGKLAMNLFWRSLDAGFFVPKLNKRELANLQDRVEQMIGLRLSHAHPEYEQVRGLLTMPRRERVPSYLVTFRKSRKNKQHFLSSDIFVGVHKEGTHGEEVDVDESVPIAVGTTVTVAKRTWPGINKLGGAGRIRKVNEETLPDGSKRYTYNVSYVLGGSEKNIERKYISVVDLNKDASDDRDKSAGVTASSSDAAKTSTKTERKQDEGADDTPVNMRLSFRVAVGGDDAQRLALPASEEAPNRRRFHWQVSVSDGSVYCERKPSPTPAKELLLHKHFDVKLQPDDAAIKECFSSVELVRLDDCMGDEIIDDEDDDDDDEEEEDVIKKELAGLQTQLRGITEANEHLFVQLTERVETEYASRVYRSQVLERIQWKNYERMYAELAAARKAFDDSDDENTGENDDDDDDGDGSGNDSEEEEDESCGGMFVNRIKAEGNEVCVLCELSGGDFAATSCDRVVHPQCAMYTPETFFKDGVVHGVNDVPAGRGRLKCADCGGRRGLSKIQCASKKCTLAFHVACAYVKGLLTREPLYQMWCPRHLKTSGMTAYLDLPPHLKNAASAGADSAALTSGPVSAVANAGRKRAGRPRGRKPKQQRQTQRARGDAAGKTRRQTPDAAAAPSAGDISSSKTNRKRKRRSSASVGRSPNGRRSRQSSVDGGAFEDDKPAVDANADLRCARRLDIDEMSDENEPSALGTVANAIDLTATTPSVDADAPWRSPEDAARVFKVNDIVEVQSRVWPGVNKPGGVARVKAVEMLQASQQQPSTTVTEDGPQVLYDVAYVLDSSREKHVPAAYVRSYVSTESASAGAVSADSRKKSRRE